MDIAGTMPFEMNQETSDKAQILISFYRELCSFSMIGYQRTVLLLLNI